MDEDVKKSKSKVSMLGQKSMSRSQLAFGKSSSDGSRLKVRKHSYGFGGVPGIRPVERTSQVAIEFKRPQLLYLPTFQLESNYPFNVHIVKKAIDATLQDNFNGHKYNIQESPVLASKTAGEIMRKVKAMHFNRYRVITVVTVGQNRAQSYSNAISFLWDHERDNYVDVQKEITTAFIQATTFGIYLD